jgi:transcriptional antiterminator RfaH
MMKKWYVLYTKPRKESKVTSQLTGIGIIAYCPMITSNRQWSDRIKKVSSPLIPSCIFINSTERDRNLVFQVPGAERYLYWLGKPAIVLYAEIEILQAWLNGDVKDAIVESLAPSELYTIKDGYFKGKKGIINEVGKNRLQLVLLDLGIKITIARDQLDN